jgi:peroxin-5
MWVSLPFILLFVSTDICVQSVLELEAAVQRNMTDASAWFDLGVKQQANERETQALQALTRAVELDPNYLAAWLALAVSHTNDGNRAGTYDAVRQWIDHNERYAGAVAQYRAGHPELADAPIAERFGSLIQCLIEMARSDTSGAVDADIQIALAVLLNTNEVRSAGGLNALGGSCSFPVGL